VINNLINYPNPFFNETRISAEHNRPDEELDIIINIYSMDGRAVRMIRTQVQSAGFRIPPIVWDGRDNGGNRLGRGLYPYSVFISTAEGETCRVSGRMIIL
jgi:flagellar hook assembly protein FlgD